ncbi:hypothetical protein B0H21DRAFT_719729 [Amylocystis lapponica]|nr:hypothetical protein B0H21DRAFT_719729 [Amylocystis lapponica]
MLLSAMEETITKRLHVSGLTPAITPADLSKRLGSFGTVTALDGFGLLDGVGQPRKFGYVTLETTKPKLARCMNLLSGVTWKGAKLRIGEAKPDYRERIALEHAALKRPAAAEGEPPAKRRRLPRGVQGVHARDMSLVTPENAASRAGWHVTSLGRLVRPVRMRPDHPLSEPIPLKMKPVKKKDAKEKEKAQKKRVRDPPTRARRRTIDPTKWGSQILTGAFLEGMAVGAFSDARLSYGAKAPAEESASESSESKSEEDRHSVSDGTVPVTSLPAPRISAHDLVEKTRTADPSDGNDLVQEKNKTLGLLQAMFGDRGDAEWGGEESVGSDVDVDVEHRARASDVEARQEEETPMEVDKPPLSSSTEQLSQGVNTRPPAEVQTQGKKLKDIFAPREEEAGFSLLGHLDLDLELDDDVAFETAAQPETNAVPEPATAPHASVLPTFDAKRSLFFPASSDSGRARDALDPTDWRKWFFRTDSADEIQTRWEETRGELTSGWKRRHREAVKSRRRRGGGAGEEV